eukprot:753733-Hanusia_phi.AAC.4
MANLPKCSCQQSALSRHAKQLWLFARSESEVSDGNLEQSEFFGCCFLRLRWIGHTRSEVVNAEALNADKKNSRK